uniref:Tetraspanin 1 n=1 Tax=Sphaeramia orbicularis TaxID=375764 RepID=A0A672ZVI6_9TELE
MFDDSPSNKGFVVFLNLTHFYTKSVFFFFIITNLKQRLNFTNIPEGDSESFVGTLFVNVGFFCIAIGAVLVLMGLLGCCGAHKESKCLLLMFFSIVLIIFIAEVAAAVVALAEGLLRAWATPTLQNDYGSEPVVTKIWNTTMTELKCCGFTNYTDFMGSKFAKENGGSLPPSCCWTHSAPCSPEEALHICMYVCIILKMFSSFFCFFFKEKEGLHLKKDKYPSFKYPESSPY